MRFAIGGYFHYITLTCNYSPTLPRLSADCILSLANGVTIVAVVAPDLMQFATTWVQTPSSLDVIAALSFPRDWAHKHLPVLSMGQEDHRLNTGYHVGEPNRQLIRCHLSCRVED
jgi:hypothetical protein